MNSTDVAVRATEIITRGGKTNRGSRVYPSQVERVMETRPRLRGLSYENLCSRAQTDEPLRAREADIVSRVWKELWQRCEEKVARQIWPRKIAAILAAMLALEPAQ